MKSIGHIAYDAFRTECGWLLPWNELPEAERQPDLVLAARDNAGQLQGWRPWLRSIASSATAERCAAFRSAATSRSRRPRTTRV